MIANAKQKQLIHLNTPNRDIKEEFVQWATGDVNKTSTNDLSFEQANAILVKLGKKPLRPTKEDSPYYWGMFDRLNHQHAKVLSYLHQLQWTKPDPKYGRVPDIERLGQWLQSKRCPVNKPLKKMDSKELNKIFTALKGIIRATYK
jgi:hypothetical protein